MFLPLSFCLWLHHNFLPIPHNTTPFPPSSNSLNFLPQIFMFFYFLSLDIFFSVFGSSIFCLLKKFYSLFIQDNPMTYYVINNLMK